MGTLLVVSTKPTCNCHQIPEGPLPSSDREVQTWTSGADCHLLHSILGQATFLMSPSFSFFTCKNEKSKTPSARVIVGITHPVGALNTILPQVECRDQLCNLPPARPCPSLSPLPLPPPGHIPGLTGSNLKTLGKSHTLFVKTSWSAPSLGA